MEFVDVITQSIVNSNGSGAGGWQNSEIRTLIKDTIYNCFPEDLKKIMLDTVVVSSHGYSETSNYTTVDKLYLLATKEIWGGKGVTRPVEYDSAEAETRQLDYYANLNVTTDNCADIVKYDLNGEVSEWWTRSVYSGYTNAFHTVSTSGVWYAGGVYESRGIAPAFKIG